MKLASVNTRMDLSIDSLVSKDVCSMVHFFSTNFVAFEVFKKIPEMGFFGFLMFSGISI